MVRACLSCAPVVRVFGVGVCLFSATKAVFNLGCKVCSGMGVARCGGVHHAPSR